MIDLDDTKGGMGNHLDPHEHIGLGYLREGTFSSSCVVLFCLPPRSL